MKKWILNHKKSSALILTLMVLTVFYGRLVWHLSYVALTDDNENISHKKGTVNDASRQELTKVIIIEPEAEQFVEKVRDLLEKANKSGNKISIGGSRHTMGGHTTFPGGYHIGTSKFNRMSVNEQSRILTVESGATWKQVIEYLNKYDLAVKVMQSNCSFSIGGSLSANCHGWQHNKQPIGSTVRSFTLMTADGEVKNCSREENRELFKCVLGGYGLFGIILEVKLEVTGNDTYEAACSIVETGDYISEFGKVDSNTGMVYGRFRVTQKKFLEEIMFVKFQKSGKEVDKTLVRRDKYLSRLVFRGSVISDYGKEVRWEAETGIGNINGKVFSRNQLCYDDVKWYRNTSAESADILHEYFIPETGFTDFVAGLKKIIPDQKANLLNITVRNVLKDEDSFLPYAKENIFGFVMLYNQKLSDQGEKSMKRLTRDLISLAQECGGTYYLPYRLHYTQEQLRQSYPQINKFFELKKKYDPGEVFQNKFYLKYSSAGH